MELHFELTDDELEAQFKSCLLDPAVFTHEAHLRIAWIYLRKYDLQVALENIQRDLKSFVESLGAKDKYSTTVTIAATKAVYHFMQKSKSHDFKNFISEFPRLKYNFKELIAFHYSIDIFGSEQAKVDFIEPDRAPFE